MPFRTGPRSGFFHSSDFARARIWRRLTPAMPMITGSIWESWFPMMRSGPERGIASVPLTFIRPHQASGRQIAIASR